MICILTVYAFHLHFCYLPKCKLCNELECCVLTYQINHHHSSDHPGNITNRSVANYFDFGTMGIGGLGINDLETKVSQSQLLQ